MRIHRTLALLLFLSLATPCSLSARPLVQRERIEFPGGEEVFYFPMALVALGDSLQAVVNQGDGSIVVFSRQWDVLRRFGRLGEAPGELVSPRDAFAWGDTLWVLSSSEISGFTAAGEYVGRRSVPVGATSVNQDAHGLFGTWMGGAERRGVGFSLSSAGEIEPVRVNASETPGVRIY